MSAMLSRFSLLLTKKSTIILYAFSAVFGLVMLAVGYVQIMTSYISNAGFDVPVVDYFSSTLVFYVPFFIVNGILLRSLLERWRLSRRSKRLFYYAEYDIPAEMTPAFAGLLIDNDIRTEEVVATLYDLERRGIIALDDSSVRLLTTDAPTTVPEKLFIEALFSRSSVFTLDSSNAMLFLSASDVFRKAMLADMRNRKLIPMPALKTKASRRFVTLIFMTASYVSIVLMAYLILSPETILTVQYPRYPMSIGEPIMELVLVMIVLTLALSGLFSETFTTDGRLTWRFAAGYRLYIEKVFKGKFDYVNNEFSREQMRILPFAIAFSIEKKPVEDLVRKFGL